NRQGSWSDDSTDSAHARGEGDQVKRGASEKCRVERAGKNMKRKITVLTLSALLLALCLSAEAQQPTKIPRIGFLGVTSPSVVADRTEGFRRGLREVGYVEGKNIIIEWRYADDKVDRLPALADELVRLNVDVIVTQGTPAAVAAQNATKTIPIII